MISTLNQTVSKLNLQNIWTSEDSLHILTFVPIVSTTFKVNNRSGKGDKLLDLIMVLFYTIKTEQN